VAADADQLVLGRERDVGEALEVQESPAATLNKRVRVLLGLFACRPHI
jgi:hypothetical protein